MELNEGLRKIFLAGVGAVATTAETAKDVVENLVKKGEITVEQGKVLNEELKKNAREKMKEHVSVTVVKEYKDAMTAVDHMKEDELEALKAKIAEVEKAAAQKAAEKAAKEAAEEKSGDGAMDEDSDDSCKAAEEAADTEDSPAGEDPCTEDSPAEEAEAAVPQDPQ